MAQRANQKSCASQLGISVNTNGVWTVLQVFAQNVQGSGFDFQHPVSPKIGSHFWAWWHKPVILALWRLRQEDFKVKAHPVYTEFQVSLYNSKTLSQLPPSQTRLASTLDFLLGGWWQITSSKNYHFMIREESLSFFFQNWGLKSRALRRYQANTHIIELHPCPFLLFCDCYPIMTSSFDPPASNSQVVRILRRKESTW